ncbi:MAG TPA: bifunctional diaminohydroxyphosphoribosylaminopyrimidine deaminase/5-amino-6-(5-phosphoribosylamino)uracil reductase RibD [Bacteroidales bacterium]|nr:bifunctional diaminohydroxyphosphoribosylaminopyrimidine deaminase/5-amino-6-(5-phosphoribosylamino)uracil reductase RibD [Bacteroidales bacterium]
MSVTEDDKFMRRCLELASQAAGMTYPNPLVGSVIVHKGQVIGEGYHLKAGMPHAEVMAVNSVKDRSLLKESTLYVNLEPCSHYGRTPPCSDLIVDMSIPRVVIGTIDTSDKVAGRGVERLKSAGCDVTTGVLGQECRWLNRRFFTFNEKKRPYIILKWAQSRDGYLDTLRKGHSGPGPNWISGKPERVLVHKWRSEEQAILVGAGTMRADNPSLNVREWGGSDPLRIILSNSGNFPAFIVREEHEKTFVVFTRNKNPDIKGARIIQLDDYLPVSVQVAGFLYREGIQSLFIEGGAAVLNHFITSDMWDEARVFTGDSDFNEGVKAPDLPVKPCHVKKFKGSTLLIYVSHDK